MEVLKFANERDRTNYLKRWSMLNVKILLCENSLTYTISEANEIILRKYLNELKNHKIEEKNLLSK